MDNNTQHPHGAPWYLVIILIVIALGASLAAVWLAIGLDEDDAVLQTPIVEMVEDEMEEDEEEVEEMEEEVEDNEEITIQTGEDYDPSQFDSPDLSIEYTYDNENRENNPQTYLTQLIRAYEGDNYCPAVSAASINGSDGLVERLQESDLLPDENTNVFLSYAQNFGERNNINRIEFCTVGDTRYAIFQQWSGFAYPHILKEGRPTLLQPISGVMDGMSSRTDLLPGELVLSTGYGDAGHMWWSHYIVNGDTGATVMIESCRDVPRNFDNGFDERLLECSIVYEQ